jgi:hypothetical protein
MDVHWLVERMASAVAVALVLSTHAYGLQAADEAQPDEGQSSGIERTQSRKCFGLDLNVSYFAERSSQSGDDLWLPSRFTFANSFDFVPATRDAREIAYGNAAFDPGARKLTIRFLSSSNRLIQETFVPAVDVRACTDSETEIYFDRSLSGDGARVRDRIKVTMSRMDSSVRIRTETDRTAYFLIFAWKRFRTYDAEFPLHE